MSADYWNSSQRNQWQFTRASLLDARRKIIFLERKMIQNGLIKDYPNIVYDYNMRIYLHNLLLKLGRRLNVRQIALATAEIYLTRFLTRVSLKEINVYLLITTCLYVSCKIEECPQHIRLIISEARNIWPEYIPHDTTKLAEFEFYLIEEMDLYLFLHHPYKSLIQLKEYFELNYDKIGFKLTDEELQNSWSLINDSYITDLHLLVPPHIIAVAAIYITIVLKKNLSHTRNKNNDSNNNISSNEKQNDKDLNIDDLMNLSQKTNTESSNDTNELKQQQQQHNQEDPKTNTNELVNFDLDILDEDTIKINKFMNFLEGSHINLDEIVEAVRDIMNLYVLWNRYTEQNLKKSLQGMLLRRV